MIRSGHSSHNCLGQNKHIQYITQAYSIRIKTFGKPGWQACRAAAQAVVEQPSLPVAASLYDPP